MTGWTRAILYAAVDVFVDALELRDLGFDGVTPAATGRPGISVADAQALHLRLSQPNPIETAARAEARRNLEVMWLTGRLVPDHKTISDFRKDNGPAIQKSLRRNL